MARIIVCDDSKLMRKMITDVLIKGGHDVVGEAKNGLEAIKKFIDLKPDLITMDILMKPDGHTAIKKIISLDPSAKIIIITKFVDNKGEVVDSVRLGAKAFLAKPIKPAVLLNEVDRLLKE